MSDMAQTSPQNIYYKMQSNRTHRKNIRLSGYRWTKYAKMLVKICQIAPINVKQAERI